LLYIESYLSFNNSIHTFSGVAGNLSGINKYFTNIVIAYILYFILLYIYLKFLIKIYYYIFIDSQKRVREMKEELIHCKELLQCKRSDLMQQWMQSIEYKEMIQMLDTM